MLITSSRPLLDGLNPSDSTPSKADKPVACAECARLNKEIDKLKRQIAAQLSVTPDRNAPNVTRNAPNVTRNAPNVTQSVTRNATVTPTVTPTKSAAAIRQQRLRDKRRADKKAKPVSGI